jgi:hypothetical protein
MSERDRILAAVEALAAARPFRVEAVERLFEVSLEREPERSNDYFTVYRSAKRPGATFAQVEARVPVPGAGPARDGLVVVDLGGEIDLGQADVMVRFGSRPEVSPPTPRQPADALVYLIYKLSWGDLRFGFSRSGSQELRAVVVDAVGSRA